MGVLPGQVALPVLLADNCQAILPHPPLWTQHLQLLTSDGKCHEGTTAKGSGVTAILCFKTMCFLGGGAKYNAILDSYYLGGL